MPKPATIWCDGEFLSSDALLISPFDLGLTVGLGAFETMLAYQGKTFLLPEHLHRLEMTTNELGLTMPDHLQIENAIPQLLGENQLQHDRARLRLTLTGGTNPLSGGDTLGKTILTATAQAAPASHATLAVSTIKQPADAGMKTLSYAHHVAALRDALHQGADEAVLMNARGELSECAMANLFLVQSGEVHTPPLESGCLPGITRAVVLELCKQLSIPAHETLLIEDDLSTADEVFITSSARDVQPVYLLGKQTSAGEITVRLRDAYRELLERTCVV